jgi:hypothetical protein
MLTECSPRLLALGLLLTLGCSEDGTSANHPGTGGTGGMTATGGSSRSGDTSATGGSSSKGGTTETGGSSAIGGSSATGGASATGGSSTTGGSAVTGGGSGTAGRSGSGGNTGANSDAGNDGVPRADGSNADNNTGSGGTGSGGTTTPSSCGPLKPAQAPSSSSGTGGGSGSAVTPLRAIDGFVTRTGTTLSLCGQPFQVLGTNLYYLQSYSVYEAGNLRTVADGLDDAVRMSLPVVRTWAFNDSKDTNDSATIRSAPGTYLERGSGGP